MDKITILVVDDEKEIADLIEIYLKNEGYEVLKANTGTEALKMLEGGDIQLVVLDIMMPGIDGLETCRKIRSDLNIPIIMLSAKSGDMDKIMGLSTGADDYMVKPFNPLELIARIKSQLRRYIHLNSESMRKDNILNIRGLVIDKEKHQVMVYEREVVLTPIEFDIVYFLASNAGRVFSTEEIFEKVWKEKYFEANNTVMVHIRRLREKLEEDSRNPVYIKTVWGVGYKIEK